MSWLKGIGWALLAALAAFGAVAAGARVQREKETEASERELLKGVTEHTDMARVHQHKAAVARVNINEAEKKVDENLDAFARRSHEPMRDRLSNWNTDRLQ